MPAGSLTLAQVADRTPTLRVACNRCDRAGQYRLASLIAEHGPDLPIPALIRLVSGDCPKRGSTGAYDLCGVLARLFL